MCENAYQQVGKISVKKVLGKIMSKNFLKEENISNLIHLNIFWRSSLLNFPRVKYVYY